MKKKKYSLEFERKNGINFQLPKQKKECKVIVEFYERKISRV